MRLLEDGDLLAQARASGEVSYESWHCLDAAAMAGATYVPGFWSLNGLNSTVWVAIVELKAFVTTFLMLSVLDSILAATVGCDTGFFSLTGSDSTRVGAVDGATGFLLLTGSDSTFVATVDGEAFRRVSVGSIGMNHWAPDGVLDMKGRNSVDGAWWAR